MSTPLAVEAHPEDWKGYPFMTVIRYDSENLCCIVDNANERTINAFVIDLCKPEKIDEEELITIAFEWYTSNRKSYPLSIEFAKRNCSSKFNRIYRTYNIDFVARVVGPLPYYEMFEVTSIRRKRKKSVSSAEVTNKIKHLELVQ